ncbi:Carbohydrate degrading enzyme [Entamoeba marina]
MKLFRTILFIFLTIIAVVLFGLLSVYIQADWVMLIAETSQPRTVWSYRNKCPRKVVALTFDDAPSASTKEFVRILNETDSTATFFFLGRRLESNYNKGNPIPSSVQNLIKCGNDVGNHMFSYDPGYLMNQSEFNESVSKTDKYLNDSFLVNNRRKWLRPASGIPSNIMYPVSTKYNYTIVAGSVHSFDRQISNTLINMVNLVARIHSGDIIIVHDLSYNIPLVTSLIQQLHNDGYEIMSLSNVDELCIF